MNQKNLYFLVFCLFINFMPSKATTYSNHVEKQYKKALNAGCEPIEVKNPATATTMGLLPGGGAFYTGQVGLGIVDALTWPFSVLWDMPLAGKRAVQRNREMTIENCKELGKI